MAKSFEQKEAELKKLPKTAAIIAIVVIVVFLGALFVNSNFARRSMTAVEVDGVKFSAAEASYFYKEAIREYENMVYSYLGDSASVMLPQQGISLSSQINESTGTTWEYFFSDNAYASMIEIGAIYADAMANGYTLNAEQQEIYDEQVADLERQAVEVGAKSLSDFVKQFYGNTINEKDYLRLFEMRFIVGEYASETNESLVFTQSDLLDYYNENKDALDSFAFRYFIVKAEPTGEAESYADDDIANAQAKAEGYITSIRNEKQFIEAAREYDAEAYAKDSSTFRSYIGEAINAVYGEWAKDPARKTGDIAVFPVSDSDTNDRFYVLYFSGRSESDYITKGIRELVIYPDFPTELGFTDAEGVVDEEGFAEALVAAEKQFDETAEDRFNTLKNAASIEDAEAEIDAILEYDFLGNYATNLYENVTMYDASFTDEALEWVYASSRKQGDVYKSLGTDGSYRILLHLGDKEVYRDYLADVRLRNAAYTEWQTNFASAEGKITFFYRLRKTAI